MNVYERIVGLCEKNNIKPSRAMENIGITKSLMTELKMGRAKSISSKTARKIAEYFGVSVDYLLGMTEVTEPMKEEGLSEQEKIIVRMFRETTEEGRMEMIAAIVNVRNHIEEKKLAGSDASFA